MLAKVFDPFMRFLEHALLFTEKMKFQINCLKVEHGPCLRLPRELRNMIYDHAIPERLWKALDPSVLLEKIFPASIGDLSGFYFPFSPSINTLHVDKQIRHEALPLVYRNISFRWSDIDDFIKFALSIGTIGRNNVESLELSWFSSSGSEYHTSEGEPDFQTSICIQLLKQFRRIKHLRLNFDDELFTVPTSDPKFDLRILQLGSSMSGIKSVQICGFDESNLDEKFESAKWLKTQLQSIL